MSSLAALGALIVMLWSITPLLSWVGIHWFDSALARILLLAAVLSAPVLFDQIRNRSNEQANRLLLDAIGVASVTSPDQSLASTPRQSTRDRLVSLGASFARSWSLDSPIPSLRGGWRDIRNRPWYLTIGASGCGKTELIRRSGMRFTHTPDSLTPNSLGLGHCWICEEAVLVEAPIAGLDPDHQAVNAQWGRLKEVMRSKRASQPLNGVLLCLNLSDVRNLDVSELDRQATQVRAQLDELVATFGITFPVYCVLTKLDTLAGFTEFCGDLSIEARKQVWGTVFEYRPDGNQPLERPEIADAVRTLVDQARNFLPIRLREEAIASRRATAFRFPNQLANLEERLVRYFAAVLAGTHCSRTLPIRGVYLTSATQRGTALDRVIFSMSESFGRAAVQDRMASESGKPYFLSELFHQRIFPESWQAGTLLNRQRRWFETRRVAMATSAAIALALSAVWVNSAHNNYRYIDSVNQKAAVLSEAIRSGSSTSELSSILPILSSIRDLARANGIDPMRPVFGYGAGLFQGDKLDSAALQSYHLMLRQSLTRPLRQQLTNQLNDERLDSALLYTTLRALVMLSHAEHRDNAALRVWVESSLDNGAVTGLGLEGRRELSNHIDSLLARNSIQYDPQVDGPAIEAARSRLRQIPVAKRIYDRIRERVSSEGGSLGMRHPLGNEPLQRLLTRDHGRALVEPQSVFFSSAGLRRMANIAEQDATGLLKEDAWVIAGIDPSSAGARTDNKVVANLVADVMSQYRVEHAQYWQNLLAQITIQKPQSASESMGMLRTMSSSSSPLISLANTIPAEFTSAAESSNDSAVHRAVALLEDYRKQIEPAKPHEDISTATRSHESPARIISMAATLPDPYRRIVVDTVTSVAAFQRSRAQASLQARLQSELTDVCKRSATGRYPFAGDSAQDISLVDFTRLFGPDGLFDMFFKEHLSTVVDTRTSPWKSRPEADPSALSGDLLQSFEQAARIRQAFFSLPGQGPSIRFELTPVAMDTASLQFTLDFDGQTLRYEHGPRLSRRFQWPGPGRGREIRIQTYPAANDSLRYTGPWALLRFLNHAEQQGASTDARQRLRLVTGNQWLELDSRITNEPNPIKLPALQAFRCPQ